MARLFDRFDPDRERWSSYLMRAEFYFDSNNITTDQKKKAALCSTMSPETFALLRNLLTREVTDVTYEEVKAALGKTEFSRCASRFLLHGSAGRSIYH